MDQRRRLQTRSSSGDGSLGPIVQGHSSAVLGHGESAGDYFNRVGHRHTRTQNLEHNRQTATYQQIEEKRASAASGAQESRYLSPAPDLGSHPSHYNPEHAGYSGDGAPWHTWIAEAGLGPGGAAAAAPPSTFRPIGGAVPGSSPGGASTTTVVRPEPVRPAALAARDEDKEEKDAGTS